MAVSLPTLLNNNLLSPFSLSISPKFSLSRTRTLHKNSINSLSPLVSLSSYQQPRLQEYEDEDHVIGDCVVFEDGVFETNLPERSVIDENQPINKKKTNRLSQSTIEPENLVPEKWRAMQEEINITKKDRRKMKQEMEFCSRVVKRRDGLLPLRDVSLAEYLEYKNTKLAQLKPVVLDNPNFDVPVREEEGEMSLLSGRVKPKNPRKAVYGGTMEDISEFFNSGSYEPGDGASNQGPRKMFTNEEKIMLKNRIPDLAVATSGKWLPLHALAASGEFYLVDTLLKYDVNINATDKHGLTAVHKAIISKKQAVTNYLLRNSADPFVRDKDGATLMHYAVRTASSHTIKILLLYDVDINQSDKEGWTPLHLAVQSRRTDLVRLLLIKGADKTLKNQDGLTPLDLCLYSGQDIRSFELIKLLKLLPKSR